MNWRYFFSVVIFITLFSSISAQVNLNRGSANYTVPLFNYSSTANSFSTNLVLAYQSGNGIKVNEVASEVGLGWKLVFGGVIQREQRGIADDQKRDNNLTYEPWAGFAESWYINSQGDIHTLGDLRNYVYGNGYLFSQYDPNDPVPIGSEWLPKYELQSNQMAPFKGFEYRLPPSLIDDREQDQFHFSFNGRNGTFVFGRDGGITILENTKLKVDVDYFSNTSELDIRTRIKSFTITDEEGIKYHFNDYNLNQICFNELSKRAFYDMFSDGALYDIGTAGNYPPNPSDDRWTHLCYFSQVPINKYIIDKWYLSEIENPRTHQKILFDFENYRVDYVASRQITQSRVPDSYSKTLSITDNRVLGSDKRIKSIKFPESEEWAFNYNEMERVDLSNSYGLKSIQRKLNGQVIDKFIFNLGYFCKDNLRDYDYNFVGADKRYPRLCLKSISKEGGSQNLQIFKFDYFLKSIESENIALDYVPPRLSLASDWYGFYNNAGKDGPYGSYWIDIDQKIYDYTCTNITPLLSLINPDPNPSSVYSRYPNIRIPSSNYFKNGLLKTVTNVYGGSFTYEYEYNQTANVDDYGNVIGSGGGRVLKTIQYDGIDHKRDIIQEYFYTDKDKKCSYWGSEKPINRYQTMLDVHTGFATQVGGVVSGEITNIMSTAIGQVFPNIVSFGAIRNCTDPYFPDTFGEIAQNYCVSSAVNYVLNTLIGFFEIYLPPSHTYKTDNYSFFPVNFNNPLPSQFSSVTVANTSSLGSFNGKTIYEFTSPNDPGFEIDFPTNEFPFIPRQRCFANFYGLPKSITVINNSDKIVKQQTYSYNPYKEILSTSNNVSKITAVEKYVSSGFAPNNVYGNTIFNEQDMIHELYYPIVGSIQLTNTTETLYDNLDNSQNVVKEYFYNPYNYNISLTRTTKSDGKVIESEVYYPEDYNLANNPVLQQMVSENMVNIPISSETWQWAPQHSPPHKLLSGSISEFGNLSNGDIKPTTFYSFESNKPEEESFIGTFNGDYLVRNNFFVPQTEIAYNSNGLPVQTKDVVSGRSSSVKYADDFHCTIATASNAAYEEIAYTSFENSGTSTDWLVADGEFSIELCPTGNRCYVLKRNSGSIISVNNNGLYIPLDKPLKLSFWATSSDFTFNYSLTPSVKGPTIFGWTYYEFNVPVGLGQTTIVGNCKIDELRLYPANANLSTTTYNEKGLKTSECDNNNRITYYEYDDLNRLVKVFDDQRNLIKTYEYHYKTN